MRLLLLLAVLACLALAVALPGKQHAAGGSKLAPVPVSSSFKAKDLGAKSSTHNSDAAKATKATAKNAHQQSQKATQKHTEVPSIEGSESLTGAFQQPELADSLAGAREADDIAPKPEDPSFVPEYFPEEEEAAPAVGESDEAKETEAGKSDEERFPLKPVIDTPEPAGSDVAVATATGCTVPADENGAKPVEEAARTVPAEVVDDLHAVVHADDEAEAAAAAATGAAADADKVEADLKSSGEPLPAVVAHDADDPADAAARAAEDAAHAQEQAARDAAQGAVGVKEYQEETEETEEDQEDEDEGADEASDAEDAAAAAGQSQQGNVVTSAPSQQPAGEVVETTIVKGDDLSHELNVDPSSFIELSAEPQTFLEKIARVPHKRPHHV